MFVKSIHLLSKEEILPAEIDLAKSLLNIFVIDVARLYGQNKCSYNLHQLKHLADDVQKWGPLWVWSAFHSEDHNGELVRMLHGSNKVDIELANTIKIFQAQRCINHLMNPEKTINVLHYCTHGPPVANVITVFELRALSSVTHLTHDQIMETHTPIFSRCKINKDIFTSKLYTRQKKRTNYYVQCKVEESIYFCAINYYITIQGISYAVMNKLIVTNDRRQEINNGEIGFNLNENIIHVRDSYSILIVPLNKIVSKVLRVENYICTFINNMERK